MAVARNDRSEARRMNERPDITERLRKAIFGRKIKREAAYEIGHLRSLLDLIIAADKLPRDAPRPRLGVDDQGRYFLAYGEPPA